MASCNAFLDVKPKDQYLEDRVFADSASIGLARQGIYGLLAADELYGGTLSMGAVDVLAQYYDLPTDHVMQGINGYDHADRYAASTFSATWRAAYQAVLNLNSFINGVKQAAHVLPPGRQAQLLGEAHGLRAYLHFDLLRLFGPVYARHPDSLAIPYSVSPSPRVQPFSPAAAVVQRVLADLDSADRYLADDLRHSAVSDAGFAMRFNRFAVLATLARVHLYAGNGQEAKGYARQLVEGGRAAFPWASDRLLTSEVIFGIPMPTMNQQYERYFHPGQEYHLLLSPSTPVLAQVYDGNIMDIRYRFNWGYFPKGGIRIDGFLKYAPPAALMPLLRLSEAYFILAECAEDEEDGIAFLEEVARHRAGLVVRGASRADALMSAYRQEFWGEGQLFYFYKRLNKAAIPSGGSVESVVRMDASRYRMPIPKEETIYR